MLVKELHKMAVQRCQRCIWVNLEAVTPLSNIQLCTHTGKKTSDYFSYPQRGFPNLLNAKANTYLKYIIHSGSILSKFCILAPPFIFLKLLKVSQNQSWHPWGWLSPSSRQSTETTRDWFSGLRSGTYAQYLFYWIIVRKGQGLKGN